MLPPFSWQVALTHWRFGPVTTALAVLAAGLYLWGTVRVKRRHPARPWPWWRTALWLGGIAVVVLATESGIGVYSESLFWVHMIQHLMLIMIAPPMLVVALPITLLLHASRNPLHTWAKRAVRSRLVTVLTWPPVGLALYAITIVATHLTGLMNTIMSSPTATDIEHAAYLIVGYLFFLPLVGREPIRWRISPMVSFLVLILAMPVDTFTGLVLGTSSTGMTGMAGMRPMGAPSPVEDVHWGGAIMWIGGDAIMLAFMMLVYVMWAHADREGTRARGWLEAVRTANFESITTQHGPATGAPPEAAASASKRPVRTHGNIDDDAHLDAYNEYLARLNQSEHPPRS